MGRRAAQPSAGNCKERSEVEKKPNLILSDRPFDLPALRDDTSFVDLSALRIANCVGCFGCWTKTPGRCVIRDDAVRVYPQIAAAEKVLYISRVQYGSYGIVMKTMLERAIPVQQAFIRVLDGETHHVQRAVKPKRATILGYGDLSAEEKEIFTQLVNRNAKNMSFSSVRIVFAAEDALEETVRNEVLAWERS